MCASSAWAQQDQGQDQGNEQANSPAPGTTIPDTRPLSGIESLGLGSLAGERSYVSPGFLVSQTAQSNVQFEPGGQAGFGAVALLGGNVALESVGRRNHFNLAYQGSAVIYETGSLSHSTAQLFGFSDSLSFRRAVFTLTDRFSYLPGLYGGLGGLAYGGALNLNGVGTLPGLNTGFVPQRGILTNGAGYSNVALAQLEYMPGARSSITLAGGFQLLDSSQQGYATFDSVIGQAGYNRSLTARDTIAVYCSIVLYHYRGASEDVNSEYVSFSYGRRVTNRLALQLFGGPQFYAITVPGRTQTSTSGYGGAALIYHWPKTQLDVNYYKGLSGGSGVLNGASSNAVIGNITRQLSTKWSGGLSFGYYQNTALQRLGSAAQPQTYNYWHGTCNLGRSLGRQSRVSFFYTFQTQSSNQSFSLGGQPGQSVLNNFFGFNFSYTFRPIGI
jgi:hypothetical protein